MSTIYYAASCDWKRRMERKMKGVGWETGWVLQAKARVEQKLALYQGMGKQ